MSSSWRSKYSIGIASRLIAEVAQGWIPASGAVVSLLEETQVRATMPVALVGITEAIDRVAGPEVGGGPGEVVAAVAAAAQREEDLAMVGKVDRHLLCQNRNLSDLVGIVEVSNSSRISLTGMIGLINLVGWFSSKMT
jgi:hypothetical protein